jgi:hypothetical protein
LLLFAGAAALLVGALGGFGAGAAEPVVVPGRLLVRGVTSRMPGGAAGGEVSADRCVLAGVGVVAAFCWVIGMLFSP